MPSETIRENRLRYVEALESGEYIQIFEMYFSYDNRKACCASGVAIDLFDYRGLPLTDAEENMLQDLGIDDNLNVEIVTWNDGERLSFYEIAAKLRLLWEL
jgi:hypothetical protein